MNLLNNYQNNVIALAIHLGLNLEELLGSEQRDAENLTQAQEEQIEEWRDTLDEAESLIENGEYLSLTDDEANDARIEYVENAMDDYLPEAMNKYGTKTVKMDDYGDIIVSMEMEFSDRGNDLASYDGAEYEQDYDGMTYYIYRR